VSVHARLGVAVVIVAAAGAVLVLVARRRTDMIPTVRVFVRLCGALAGLQALIGLVLLAIGERPAEGIHLFYGAATVIPIPLAEVYAKRFPARDETMLLLYGAAATALFGLRAITTGNS
jgi:asparagine N-glycosylation enzyme membrane subunit Stt3